MTGGGLAALPGSTLVDRALVAMAERARRAEWLATHVLGLTHAPTVVAERLMGALLGADPRVSRTPDGAWSLVAAARGAPMIDECAFAVVDIETTGMRSRRLDDRITEIAVVLLCGERRELIFESLVNPGRPIPGLVSSITGITDQMVRAAPRFEEICDRLLDVLAGRIFVAHNARFDWGFVSSELRRARDLRLDGPRLCTVRLARRLVPAAESCSLGALSYHFAFENPARHRAAGDAMVTAQLLHRLMGLARETGARTLTDLELLQGPKKRSGKRAKRRAQPYD
ncbi:MAG TPA: 3'-5' exonuclease [Gemmatimonadales bacterium]|nr:3'-5' exonuclease [Gemmatimonadales bacterium]